MNISSLLAGFSSYLQELNEISGKNYDTTTSTVSIFMYSNEFKNYLSDELNVDSSTLSMSINDILDMEIVNGKFVEEEDEEETETTSTTSDNASEEITVAEDTEASAEIESTDTTAAEATDTEINLTELLNSLFEEESVKNIIDTNLDSELSEEEIQAFLDTIKDYDENGEDVSLDDIIATMESIEEGTFTIAGEETDDDSVDATSSTSSTSGTSGSSGSSGSYSSGSTTTEKTLDNMNAEELSAELSSAQTDLSDKQAVLASILDGSNAELQALQENIDAAYEIYLQELKNVDEDLAEQVDDLAAKISDQEDEIDDKEQQISDQECVVSDAETAYNNAVATRETLESSLATLKALDSSDFSDEKLEELTTKIADLEAKIEEAKEAEDTAKADWVAAQETLDALEDDKDVLENDLDDLNENMKALEEEILEKYPEIEEYLNDYNEAKEEYDSTKESLLINAQADVDEAQDYVDEVQTAINNYDNKVLAKEYILSSDLEAAVEWARQYDDYSQSQMQEIFAELGYQFDYGAWCADFVKMVLYESVGEENLPDWYTNITNKAYVPNIQSAGEGHQVSAEEAQPGDLVLYDWDGDGIADHVGIFVDNGDGSTNITAIEGNTSGAGGSSSVEEKTRNRSCIVGIYSMS